ncbi:MAG: ABC transporter permease [Sedimentisphaerales bacterium]|nr:ABC transporter permease [Sedimentisphaerales bacterium]
MEVFEKQETAVLFVQPMDGESLILTLEGHLDFRNSGRLWNKVLSVLSHHSFRQIVIDTQNIHSCDSSGLALLFEIQLWAKEHDTSIEILNLKREYAEFLNNFSTERFTQPHLSQHKHIHVAEEIGRATVILWHDFQGQVNFVGQAATALAGAAARPWRIRWKDLFLVAEQAGANAVGIVVLLGFLFGLIITFSSALPLRQFGVEVYVSDLAALALVRVLGPFITAIILAGRSGSAFAAEIGTMKINNEIDALETMGLDPIRFLVVPRIIATTLVTPLLAILANLAGMVGSAVVMISLGFTLRTFVSHVNSAISPEDVYSGLMKCFVFGTLVSGVGCFRGLQTETGASAVGISTTRAVVSGIVLVVIAEGVFAVLYHFLEI